MFSIKATAIAATCLVSTASAQCEYTPKGGFEPAIFIAGQGYAINDRMDMYGVVRTDCFLVGGSVYAAGSPDENNYTLDTFLTRTPELLTQAMNNYVEANFPNRYQQAYDETNDTWYNFVPADRFTGLVIMDIEGENLVAHPDTLIEHYEFTVWNGLSGHNIVNRIMAQYGLCADITDRAFPGGKVGLFSVVRGRRNGRSSDQYVRKVNFFKQKAADPANWLHNVDYLCPAVWSAWSPEDEVNSCQMSGNTIHSCAGRYLGAIDVTIGAFTRGPLVDYSNDPGNEKDPYGGTAIREPENWISIDPVRDANGNAFKICPLLSVQVLNSASCADQRFAVEPGVDPTLTQTIAVMTEYLDTIVFDQPACYVDCYGFWTPHDIPFQPTRDTLTALPWPMLGDYNGNGRIGVMDDRIFTRHFDNNDPRADLNTDGLVDRFDRCIMDNLLGDPCQ